MGFRSFRSTQRRESRSHWEGNDCSMKPSKETFTNRNNWRINANLTEGNSE